METSLFVSKESAKLHNVAIPEGVDRITLAAQAIHNSEFIDDLRIHPVSSALPLHIKATHSSAYFSDFESSSFNGKSNVRYSSQSEPAEIRTSALCSTFAASQMPGRPIDELATLRQIRALAAGDTPIVETTFQAAMLSAGALISAIDNVLAGGPSRAFCLTRPPGHHAEWETAMGFCYFNNVAVAANYLIAEKLASRVAIVDFDVHHGNGTQHLFYDVDNVLVCNLHRDPTDFYPYFCGFENETGRGPGEGYNLNVTLPAGSDEKNYLEAFGNVIERLENFKPDWILVSAGFDAHKNDPLGGMKLESSTYFEFAKLLCKVADEHCGGKLLSVLEGGYNRQALGESICEYLRGLIHC